MKNTVVFLILALSGFSFTAYAKDKTSAPARIENFMITCEGDDCPEQLPKRIEDAILFTDPLPTVVESDLWSPAAKILAVGVLTLAAGGIGGVAGWSSGHAEKFDETGAYYRDTRLDSALLAGGISAGSMLVIGTIVALVVD